MGFGQDHRSKPSAFPRFSSEAARVSRKATTMINTSMQDRVRLHTRTVLPLLFCSFVSSRDAGGRIHDSSGQVGATTCPSDPCPSHDPNVTGISYDPAMTKAGSSAGQGGLCLDYTGKVVGSSPVYVYRLYGSSETRHASACGKSWAFESPDPYSQQAADSYRRRYGVCEEYNPLYCLIRCILPLDVEIHYGPTQSTNCDSGECLPATQYLQAELSVSVRGNMTNCDVVRWNTNPSDQGNVARSGCDSSRTNVTCLDANVP